MYLLRPAAALNNIPAGGTTISVDDLISSQWQVSKLFPCYIPQLELVFTDPQGGVGNVTVKLTRSSDGSVLYSSSFAMAAPATKMLNPNVYWVALTEADELQLVLNTDVGTIDCLPRISVANVP